MNLVELGFSPLIRDAADGKDSNMRRYAREITFTGDDADRQHRLLLIDRMQDRVQGLDSDLRWVYQQDIDGSTPSHLLSELSLDRPIFDAMIQLCFSSFHGHAPHHVEQVLCCSDCPSKG